MQITFYEKPGCINNTKQKDLLKQAGHRLIEKNLLTNNWTESSLRPFFGDKSVVDWFNKSAPAIKNKEINPEEFTEEAALKAMIETPLLIRRPLIEVENSYSCGFDTPLVESLLKTQAEEGIESCPQTHSKPCSINED